MKPILVGLNNPYSTDPAFALYPYPERSAGHRLWKMYADLDPIYVGAQAAQIDKARYASAFDRRNLFGARIPPAKERPIIAQRMMQTFPRGSTIILLGADVRQAFNTVLTPRLENVLIHPQVRDGLTWRCLPHPSGRVTQYNDPVFRMLAGMVLVDVLQQCSAGD